MATNSVSADSSTAFAIMVVDSAASHGRGLVARHRSSQRRARRVTRTLPRNRSSASSCRSRAPATIAIMPRITRRIRRFLAHSLGRVTTFW